MISLCLPLWAELGISLAIAERPSLPSGTRITSAHLPITDADAGARGIAPGKHPPMPVTQEPAEYDPREIRAYYDWRNDLFFRLFDLEMTGRTDFMTARRTFRVSQNEFGNPVVLTLPNPLFYWVDLDLDGKFEPDRGEMWSDPEEDGINGNEREYSSPGSGNIGVPEYPFKPLR